MEMSSQLDFNIKNCEPLIIVISGLSGAGKDTIVKSLKKREVPFRFCITATSRAPREGEINGEHYFFYSKEEFEQKIAAGDFLEYALVYEQYKGVPKSQVDEALATGQDIVIRVDYQGAATIKKLYSQAVLIFVIPENAETWWKRLTDRGGDTYDQLEIRKEHAQIEIEAAGKYFDYVVVNPDGDIDQALDTIISIIEAEHQRIRRC
jgi:guanylate kinase